MITSVTIRPLRVIVLALMVALVASASAAASHHHRYVPPGNSGASQYVETVPTASGNRPTSSIHRHHGKTVAVSASSSSSGPGGPGGGSAIPSSTAKALSSSRDSAGVGAANLAQATVQPRIHISSARLLGSNASTSARTGTGVPRGAPSAASSVLDALTGSTSAGGLGLLLPILLIVTFLGSAAAALRRRRRTT